MLHWILSRGANSSYWKLSMFFPYLWIFTHFHNLFNFNLNCITCRVHLWNICTAVVDESSYRGLSKLFSRLRLLIAKIRSGYESLLGLHEHRIEPTLRAYRISIPQSYYGVIFFRKTCQKYIKIASVERKVLLIFNEIFKNTQ